MFTVAPPTNPRGVERWSTSPQKGGVACGSESYGVVVAVVVVVVAVVDLGDVAVAVAILLPTNS